MKMRYSNKYVLFQKKIFCNRRGEDTTHPMNEDLALTYDFGSHNESRSMLFSPGKAPQLLLLENT